MDTIKNGGPPPGCAQAAQPADAALGDEPSDACEAASCRSTGGAAMNEEPEHEMLEPDWQHLKRYGYAPGGYLARCRRCEEMVEFVDKRATCCRPCATQQYAAEIGRQMQGAEGAGEMQR